MSELKWRKNPGDRERHPKPDMKVQVRWKNGNLALQTYQAKQLYWKHRGSAFDIDEWAEV